MMHPSALPLILHHALRTSAEEGQIVGMPAQQEITTIEALLALPDDGMRHELLDGEHVVTPSPRFVHQLILGEVWEHLRDAVGDRDDIDVLSSPADIYLGPRTLVQPDLFIVSVPAERRSSIAWKDVPTPLLAVEILSPSTASRDRGKKRRIYLEAEIEEYWIVDIDARLIERWRIGNERPEIVDGELRWELSIGVSGVADVAVLFAKL